jgi:hypothetical protein
VSQEAESSGSEDSLDEQNLSMKGEQVDIVEGAAQQVRIIPWYSTQWSEIKTETILSPPPPPPPPRCANIFSSRNLFAFLKLFYILNFNFPFSVQVFHKS